MKQTCPTCGGEGVLFEQLDVDYFKPVEQCPECEGTEWVNVKCDECGLPFTDEEWKVAKPFGDVYYHSACLSEEDETCDRCGQSKEMHPTQMCFGETPEA